MNEKTAHSNLAEVKGADRTTARATGGDRRVPLDRLAEEFVARLRAGQRPHIGDYVAAHPQLADEIQELFPTLRGRHGHVERGIVVGGAA